LNIPGDYSFESAYITNIAKRAVQNLVHASGSKKEAEFEKKLWFKKNEIYSY